LPEIEANTNEDCIDLMRQSSNVKYVDDNLMIRKNLTKNAAHDFLFKFKKLNLYFKVFLGRFVISRSGVRVPHPAPGKQRLFKNHPLIHKNNFHQIFTKATKI